jgi:hypothetical protein
MYFFSILGRAPFAEQIPSIVNEVDVAIVPHGIPIKNGYQLESLCPNVILAFFPCASDLLRGTDNKIALNNHLAGGGAILFEHARRTGGEASFRSASARLTAPAAH